MCLRVASVALEPEPRTPACKTQGRGVEGPLQLHPPGGEDRPPPPRPTRGLLIGWVVCFFQHVRGGLGWGGNETWKLGVPQMSLVLKYVW